MLITNGLIRKMRLFRIFIMNFLSIAAIFLSAAGDPSPPEQVTDEVKSDLSYAFEKRLNTSTGFRPQAFDLFTPEIDTAFIAPDGKTVVICLALRDDLGRILASW
jgi:hypothetical protein